MRLRIVFPALLAVALSACGLNNPDTPPGPPIPDSPREHKGAGTPLFQFGGGNRLRGGFDADDEQYREYLLWKEWQEYQNYLLWQKNQAGGGEQSNETQ